MITCLVYDAEIWTLLSPRDVWQWLLDLSRQKLKYSRCTGIPPGLGRAGASTAKEGIGLAMEHGGQRGAERQGAVGSSPHPLPQGRIGGGPRRGWSGLLQLISTLRTVTSPGYGYS